MKNIDVKKIMEMATYGRPVVEQGDYSIDYSPVATGRDHNQTNQMGDNPLPLEEDTGEVTELMLDHLYDILHNAGKSDSDIALNNVKIKPTSAEKVLRTIAPGQSFQNPAEFLSKALAALATRMDPEKEAVVEFQEIPSDARFVHNIDTMGNVKVTDSQTGKEIVLTGEDALDVIGELEMYGDSPEKVQEILANYQHVMEGDLSEDGETPTGSTSAVVSGLNGVMVDVRNMQNKLDQMVDRAENDGDVVAAFAAKLFTEEVSKLSAMLEEYLKQQS